MIEYRDNKNDMQNEIRKSKSLAIGEPQFAAQYIHTNTVLQQMVGIFTGSYKGRRGIY
jgi:hypothetical protein